MQYVSDFWKVTFLVLFFSIPVWALDEKTSCFRLDEKSIENIDRSPFVLCLHSSDL